MADGNLAPSERIIITYVAFLCSRLLDIRTEAKVSPENPSEGYEPVLQGLD